MLRGELANTMKEATICVPATSANLGPGYDCLGRAWPHELGDHVGVQYDQGKHLTR